MSSLGLLFPLVPPSDVLAATTVTLENGAKVFVAATPNWFEIFKISAAGIDPVRRRVHTGFCPGCMQSFRPAGADSDWLAIINGKLLMIAQFDNQGHIAIRHKFTATFSPLSGQPQNQTIAVHPSQTRFLAHIGANVFFDVSFPTAAGPPKCKMFSYNGEPLKQVVWISESEVAISSEIHANLSLVNSFKVAAKRFIRTETIDDRAPKTVALLQAPAGCYAVSEDDVKWYDPNNVHEYPWGLYKGKTKMKCSIKVLDYLLVMKASGALIKISLRQEDPEFVKQIAQLPIVFTTMWTVDEGHFFCASQTGIRMLMNLSGEILFQESLLGIVSGLDYSFDRNGHQRFQAAKTEIAISGLSSVNLACEAKVLDTVPCMANRLIKWEDKFISTSVTASRSWKVDMDAANVLTGSKIDFAEPGTTVLAASGEVMVTTRSIEYQGKPVFHGEFECATIYKNIAVGALGRKITTFDVISAEQSERDAAGDIYSILLTGEHLAYSTVEKLYIDDKVAVDLERCHQLLQYEHLLVGCHPGGWVSFLTWEGQVFDRYFVGIFVGATQDAAGRCLLAGSGKGALLRLTKWGLVGKSLRGLPQGSSVVHVDKDIFAIGGPEVSIFKVSFENQDFVIKTEMLPGQSANGVCRVDAQTWATVVTRNTRQLLKDDIEPDPPLQMVLAETADSKVNSEYVLDSSQALGLDLVYVESGEHDFRGLVVVGNDMWPPPESPPHKSVCILFDLNKKIVLDRATVEGSIVSVKRTRGPHFLLAVDSVVQSWRVKFAEGSNPKLEHRRNIATVGRILSSLDYRDGYLLVADQVMSVSVAKAKNTVELGDIMTCPSISWPVEGVILDTSPLSLLISTMDNDIHVMVPDESSAGGLATKLHFDIGQTLTYSIRSSYDSFLEVVGNRSSLLSSIAPQVFFGTDSGAIYGFRLLTGETAEMFAAIKEKASAFGTKFETDSQSATLDASKLLLHGYAMEEALLRDKVVTKEQFDELMYAVQKVFS